MNKATKTLAVMALVSSVLAAGAVLLLPCWYPGAYVTPSLSEGPLIERSVTSCQSMIETNGWGIAVWVLLPILLAGVGVFASWKQMVSAVWTVAVLALLFSFVTVFSIGWLFAPVTLLLFAAAVLQHTGRGKASSPLEL